MDPQSRTHRSPGSDPLLGRPTTTDRVGRSGLDSPTSDETPRQAARTRASRHRHPARSARALALAASVVATGAVASGLAYSEGAWGGANTEVASGSAGSAAMSATGVDTTVASPSTIESDADVPAAPSTTAETTSPATTSPATTPADAPAATSGYADGVQLGTAEYTEWGNVQVEVTIGDGVIVDVAAVEYPTGRRSNEINDQAVPMLEAQAIALQSADLDIVSGATYTSRAYADSLQAALDQAAIASAQEASSS